MAAEVTGIPSLLNVADPAAEDLTDLQKKHLPVITLSGDVSAGRPVDVTVEVGKLLAHPNEPGHFIEFVELFYNDAPVVRLDLSAGGVAPVLKVSVAFTESGVLKAVARCNLHGAWATTTQVTIS